MPFWVKSTLEIGWAHGEGKKSPVSVKAQLGTQVALSIEAVYFAVPFSIMQVQSYLRKYTWDS